MTTLQRAERLLESMSRAEKAQLLQWVVRDLGDAFPGIERSAAIHGGDACVVRTRVPVWILDEARRQGATDAELLSAYPMLRAEDLANAWAYARAHAAELEQARRANES